MTGRDEVLNRLQALHDDIVTTGNDEDAEIVVQIDRIIQQYRDGAPLIGAWGFVDGEPLHLPSYYRGQKS